MKLIVRRGFILVRPGNEPGSALALASPSLLRTAFEPYLPSLDPISAGSHDSNRAIEATVFKEAHLVSKGPSFNTDSNFQKPILK